MFRTDYIKDAKLKIGNEIEIAGWVHKFIDMGKLKFLTARDRTGEIQVTAKKGIISDEQLFAKITANREYVVRIHGVIKENKIAPEGVELIPSKYEVLNIVDEKLPVDPTDEIPADLDTRLEHRYLDLRRKKINAIFELKSIIVNTYRKKLLEMDFVEIHPPAIIATASEGGTDVYELKYFEHKAYLAQSPQLYKQIAVIGGLDRVFVTMPVFRAEKHNTATHLNEITMLDAEIGFADHHDAMDVFEIVFIELLKVARSKPELLQLCGANSSIPQKIISQKIKRITYTEAVDMLKKNGEQIEWGCDFSREQEKKIYALIGEEAFFIYEYPTAIRAFYSMPKESDPKICNAFDFIYKGLEISSGAQRIHKVDVLEHALKSRGLDPQDFKFYVNAFKFGAPPHAGFGLGLERMLMKMCNLDNIRETSLFPRDRTRLCP
ncbi:MAG: aspartate--tRNA(Asn) ligase [Candidatus Micrarchaeota archaeon]